MRSSLLSKLPSKVKGKPPLIDGDSFPVRAKARRIDFIRPVLGDLIVYPNCYDAVYPTLEFKIDSRERKANEGSRVIFGTLLFQSLSPMTCSHFSFLIEIEREKTNFLTCNHHHHLHQNQNVKLQLPLPSTMNIWITPVHG